MKLQILAFLLALVVAAPLSYLQAQSDINLTGYTQTFDEEFNSLSVTTNSPKGASTWYYWPPYGAAGAYSSSTWDVNAFSVNSGILSDKAWLDSSNNWHSGNLSSMDPTGAGFGQQYGYFEIRCQMPSSGTGAWPAFWIMSQNSILNNNNGTSLPNIEIDVFEWYGTCYTNNQNVIQEASHNWTPSGGPAGLYSPQTPMPGGAFPWQGYHIYGCQVDPTNITWYIDGVQTNQIATPAGYVTSPFYMMVDYALGGGWPLTGMVNNSTLNVDWVRVYALPSGGGGGTNSIGMQFQGSGTALASTDSAGLSTVAQSHWNVLTGASFSSHALTDSSGANTTATLSGSANGTYWSGGSSAPPAGNAKLASGELFNGWPGSPTLTVSNIPYANYDVYVYAGIDATGRAETVGLTPSGGAEQFYSFTTEGGGSAWTAATSTWNGTGTKPSLPSANYVHYTGLTASSFTLAWGAPGNGGLNGIQIVPVTPKSIGVQFKGSGTALASTDSAGLSTVAQTNWNVLTGASFTNQVLSDNSGASTTATLTGSANGTYWSGGSSAPPAGNAKLASGELFNGWPGSPTTTIANIPYAKYDVYVYAAIDATGRAETVGLTPSGGTEQFYSFTTEGGGSAWTAATSTWNGTGTQPSLPSANYVHYTGLTASSFTLAWGAPGNGGLNGIQIVPTP